jgi:putative transposase
LAFADAIPVCIVPTSTRRLARKRVRERLWKSVKYEEVYLHAYDSVAAARAGIGNCFAFYNGRRPHTALYRNTPDNVCLESQPLAVAA